MANRVTDSEVKEIISTTISDASPYITPANILTDKVEDVGGISDSTQLKEIERWLAAHFIATSNEDQFAAGLSSKDVSDASAEFLKSKQVLSKGLESTYYGQQALLLDTSEFLRTLGRRKAKFETVNISVKD